MTHRSPRQRLSHLAPAACAFALTGALIAPLAQAIDAPLATAARQQPATLAADAASLAPRPRIQVAILLDTSNSMDGLIDQTRNQLWQVVNAFAEARRDGVVPLLEIALFDYGNSGIPAASGFVRRLVPFTGELDAISASLFALTTNGGSEYCGQAIVTALETLQWSRAADDIKTIFIAGNEHFNQGPIGYREAIREARRLGVSVNTIHAGDHATGVAGGWQAGALLAGGEYLSIDANQRVVHIVAPQDARLAELNAQLNATYVPYGSEGAAAAERQLEQDALNEEISAGLLAKRAASKASSAYRNSNWDLVDALGDGEVGADDVGRLEAADLPEPMRALDVDARLDYLQQKAEQRDSIQREIAELARARADYVAAQRRAQAQAPTISDALIGAVKNEAARKGFAFAD